MYSFINKEALEISPATFTKNVPYPHVVIENFFRADIAEELSRGFPDYDGGNWNTYDNPLENKKLSTHGILSIGFSIRYS